MGDGANWCGVGAVSQGLQAWQEEEEKQAIQIQISDEYSLETSMTTEVLNTVIDKNHMQTSNHMFEVL